MWSLDSTLRYVPINALHDGKHYLVEQFRNTVITPASMASLAEPNSGNWRGAGFGVSEEHAGFPPLPSVPEELHRIFRVQPEEAAPVDGSIRLDAEFTKSSFQQDLAGRVNPIVHIATHFDAQPGVAANSNLLLGDGTKLSLEEIKDSTRLFDAVDLLTLSACSTGFQIDTADGVEVDSLGSIAHNLGAKGVVASLWNVSDEATAVLMQSLYRNWKEHPELGKGEALRHAQRQMIAGELHPDAEQMAARGLGGADAGKPPRNWQHPYYWAPFIQIGNSR
jgi:CHAT domain-containing protein